MTCSLQCEEIVVTQTFVESSCCRQARLWLPAYLKRGFLAASLGLKQAWHLA